MFVYNRKAWIRLGDMSKEDAQKELVQLLYKAAPHLEDYVTQQWKALKLGTTVNGKMYGKSKLICCQLFIIYREKDKSPAVVNDQVNGQVGIFIPVWALLSWYWIYLHRLLHHHHHQEFQL